MYPIYCPVVTPLATAISLGALERSVGQALNHFSNQGGALTVPLISRDWGNLTQVGLRSAVTAEFVKSMRRLSDEAEALAERFRELQQRMDRRTTAQPESPAATARASTLPAFAFGDEDRFEEMKSRFVPSQPKRAQVSARSRWFLAVRPKRQGSVFVSEDGRCIHLHRIQLVSPESVVLGYGWHQSLMHYLDINATHPAGRSIAVFSSNPAYRTDVGTPWFVQLVQSMLDFCSPTDRNVSIAGHDKKRKALQRTGSAADAGFLQDVSRSLNYLEPFTVETEKLIDGSRKPNLAGVTPPVPTGSIRYAIERDESRLFKSLYRPVHEVASGEDGLPDEVKRGLFTRLP